MTPDQINKIARLVQKIVVTQVGGHCTETIFDMTSDQFLDAIHVLKQALAANVATGQHFGHLADGFEQDVIQALRMDVTNVRMNLERTQPVQRDTGDKEEGGRA